MRSYDRESETSSAQTIPTRPKTNLYQCPVLGLGQDYVTGTVRPTWYDLTEVLRRGGGGPHN